MAFTNCVRCLAHNSTPTWVLRNTIGPDNVLQDLFVDTSARGQGAGRALIEFVYAKAKESGASRVWWLTHETNTDAMLLYDRIAAKSGFVQYRKLL